MRESVENSSVSEGQDSLLRSSSKKLLTESGIAFSLICLCAFLGNYSLISRFGIYEDDYLFFFFRAFDWNWQDFLADVRWNFVHLPQGRPLGFSLEAFLSFIGSIEKNAQFAHLIGWIIISLNGFLIFRICRNRLSFICALAGGLFFVLDPANLAKQIVMHRGFIHLTITPLLCAFLLYQSEFKAHRVWSYAVAALSLIIWEAGYLPFLFAPFLTRDFRFTKQWIVRFVIHAITFFGVAGGVVISRNILGEERASLLVGGLQENVPKMAFAMLAGLVTSLRAAMFRPVDTLFHAGVTEWLYIGAALLVLSAVFFRTNGLQEREAIRWRDLLILVAGGLGACAFSYVLAFRPSYFPPNTGIGRLTVVHAVGAVGISIAFAGFFEGVLSQWSNRRAYIVSVCVAFLALLVGFGVHIQNTEYVESWALQKKFWQSIIDQCRDVKPKTEIVVDVEHDPGTQGFWGSWPVNYTFPAFEKFISFPGVWKRKPRVFGFAEYVKTFPRGNGVVLVTPFWSDEKTWPELTDGDFIYLRFENGELHRSVEPVTIGGITLRPKPVEDAPPLKLSKLGRNMLGEANSQNWFTVSHAKPYGSF
jgi:hypothetical protein